MQTKVLAVDDDTAILAMLKRYFAWRLPEFDYSQQMQGKQP